MAITKPFARLIPTRREALGARSSVGRGTPKRPLFERVTLREIMLDLRQEAVIGELRIPRLQAWGVSTDLPILAGGSSHLEVNS